MELRHLRYFVAVAEELHFGRGAARLRVAQPALSQQIKQLERELGVELLARTKRRVALTEPGRLFLPEARRTLAQAAAAVDVARRAAAGEVGRLRIGYVDAALWGILPTILGAFRERHPAVRLALQERLPAQQAAALRQGVIDVGIAPPPRSPTGIDTMPVSEERVVLALPATHPLAAEPEVALTELAHEPWVLVPGRTPSRLRELVLATCASAGFTPRVAQEAKQLDALVALVSAGLGVTLVPHAAGRVPRAGVVYRPLRGVDVRFPLVAAWMRGDPPPTVQSFLAVLRQTVDASAAAAAP
jgi:DNA-binding transcriptional LysR family regulator